MLRRSLLGLLFGVLFVSVCKAQVCSSCPSSGAAPTIYQHAPVQTIPYAQPTGVYSQQSSYAPQLGGYVPPAPSVSYQNHYADVYQSVVPGGVAQSAPQAFPSRPNIPPAVAKLRTLTDGRPFLKALVDNQYTRSVSIYGGFEDFNQNGADLANGTLDLKDGDVYGVNIGRRHSRYLTSVWDYSFRQNEFTNSLGATVGEVEVNAFMKNLYIDLFPNQRLTPYGGFGFGIADINVEPLGDGSPEIDDTVFAYQVYGGLTLKLRSRLSSFVEYRFFSTNELEGEDATPFADVGNYSSHNLLIGLRFGF